MPPQNKPNHTPGGPKQNTAHPHANWSDIKKPYFNLTTQPPFQSRPQNTKHETPAQRNSSTPSKPLGTPIEANQSFGTKTSANPRATDPQAGIPLSSLKFSPSTNCIIEAIEKSESSKTAQGEIPARLHNASGTPASFGRGQLIGESAVDLLKSNKPLAQHYNLGIKPIQDLTEIATNTRRHFKSISSKIPPGGTTEKDLLQKISDYTAKNKTNFEQDTGLQPEDITRMFRAAQLRAQMPATPLKASFSPTDVLLNKIIDSLMANPDFKTNTFALGVQRTDLRAYAKKPDNHGEHMAGFTTKALFNSPYGQALRNAMTDNSGIAMSRILINQNIKKAHQKSLKQLRRQLTFMESAEAAMLMHNRGEGALNPFLRTVNQKNRTQDPYVQKAMRNLPKQETQGTSRQDSLSATKGFTPPVP
ncbi:hypothetical protein ACIHQR_02290 [Corallococcus coralloides]|uniref:hypothetical protein n=1 Tax=Corallococcus coralloides TaxID=184914 RepID=UPI00384B7BFE